jgi:hypothetical protein
MDQSSLKLYFLNLATLYLSFTNLESMLKIVLLCVSIVYTIMKIVDWFRERKKQNEVK